jgi:hypothetical protein
MVRGTYESSRIFNNMRAWAALTEEGTVAERLPMRR